MYVDPLSPQPRAGRERLLSANEVAELLNVTPRQVWRWRGTGRLVAVKLGRCTRFKLSDIERVMSKGLPNDFDGATV